MVEVQMQHESISGQYQDELRLRPDTLNKLSSTREICDVLEEYSERLKDTLSRCKSDQASLYEAYQKSGKIVRDMKQQHERNEEKNMQLINNLNEKVAASNEHQNKLIEFLTAAKQQVDADHCETKRCLLETRRQKDELSASIAEIGCRLEQAKYDIQMKDAALTKIKQETNQLIQQLSAQNDELNNKINHKDKDLAEALETIKALQGAVSNQDVYAAELREQHSKLQDQLAYSEQCLQAADEEKKQLLEAIQNLTDGKDNLKNMVADLTASKEQLENIVKDKEEAIQKAATDIESLELKLMKIESEKDDLATELAKVQNLCANHVSEIDALQASCLQLQNNIQNTETEFKDYRQESEGKIKELTVAIDIKEKDLDTKACTIAQLMCEVGTAGETAARLEAALQKLKIEADLERQAATERDAHHKRQLEHTQTQVAEKENELSKQMTIILDMRSEKDRLQEKIQSMQNKIDNIQKELSEPQPRAPIGDAPELDDNAVAFAPTPRPPPSINAKQHGIMKSPILKPQKKNKLPENGKLDSMLFSMFSDTSMDEDSNMIDRREVDRRFEALARGEPLPPTSINSLKRRKLPSGGLRPNDEEDMSLSQIKQTMKHKEPRKFFKNVRAGNKK
ncbi:putative leucine-rich repeat-containing protein DDB_G0290503 isoform X1 [Amyelois transitella]|uniref:putative leucine-rich repeat-containing protein DDB_G0290503 isoform X1 n=1 Tax=Amyelois transitella TaxID=680683 RepID=UPI00298F5224|nr:putative leucine-rich repeat-containing protein DDB_G0290503 isoform X1 [Amyelois transitella]XP_060805188.1 putative leucine-rich repeat-containing protein DDB_G0290503 isoform X1 [Amyelois transitella]